METTSLTSIQGGEWLIKESVASETFISEDFNLSTFQHSGIRSLEFT